MAKVNQTQIYAIRWLNYEGKTVEFIATELDLTEKQVLNIIEKYSSTKTAETDKVKTVTSSIKSKDLMITKTAAKNHNSVAIMTKEASELNDAMKKNPRPDTRSDAQKGIFRPNSK